MKKAIALAVAVGALTALVLPTTAMAKWTHFGLPIAGNETVFHTGTWQISGGVAGTIQCQMTVEFTLTAGTTTGHVTQNEVDLDEAGSTVTQKCQPAGPTAGCQIHAMTANNLPWIIHTQGIDLLITTNGWTTSLTGLACPTTKITVTEGTVTAVPDKVSGVSFYKLEGTLKAHSGAESFNVSVGGTLNVLEPNIGTFGI
jgi:hypothetical protein